MELLYDGHFGTGSVLYRGVLYSEVVLYVYIRSNLSGPIKVDCCCFERFLLLGDVEFVIRSSTVY